MRTWVLRFDTAPGPYHRDQGLLAQSTAVTSPRWSTPINARTTRFRAWITHVAIDMAAEYAKAVRHASPHAQIVVDHFHVVKLANQMIDDVRRRTTQALRGRRGGACDPEWTSHRRLLRGVERLTDPQRQEMFNNSTFDADSDLLATWITKELVLPACCRCRVGSAAQHGAAASDQRAMVGGPRSATVKRGAPTGSGSRQRSRAGCRNGCCTPFRGTRGGRRWRCAAFLMLTVSFVNRWGRSPPSYRPRRECRPT